MKIIHSSIINSYFPLTKRCLGSSAASGFHRQPHSEWAEQASRITLQLSSTGHRLPENPGFVLWSPLIRVAFRVRVSKAGFEAFQSSDPCTHGT